MQNAQEETGLKGRTNASTKLSQTSQPRSFQKQRNCVVCFESTRPIWPEPALSSCAWWQPKLEPSCRIHREEIFPNAQKVCLHTHSTYSTSFIEAPADTENYYKLRLMYTQSRTALASGTKQQRKILCLTREVAAANRNVSVI